MRRLFEKRRLIYHLRYAKIRTVFRSSWGAIHSTKISGNFGPKLNGSVRSNRKSFEKTGPPFEVDHISRSDRLEFWLNGSRPWAPAVLESRWAPTFPPETNKNIWRWVLLRFTLRRTHKNKSNIFCNTVTVQKAKCPKIGNIFNLFDSSVGRHLNAAPRKSLQNNSSVLYHKTKILSEVKICINICF